MQLLAHHRRREGLRGGLAERLLHRGLENAGVLEHLWALLGEPAQRPLHSVRDRLAGQVPTPVRSIPNISYRVRERLGPGWALLGDAGGFIDPIFSSGVLLATRAGWRLGNALADLGVDGDLTTWKAQTDHDLATFFAFIRLWYDGHFIDNLFFSDLRDPAIYRGIISLLAGNTTRPDNAFLVMLNRRMADERRGMPAAV